MNKEERINLAGEIMLDFAAQTGVSQENKSPRRYLWTDAFAVFNFLELYHRTQDEEWLMLARHLVDQVHQTLGRHRPDSARSGWLSGLGEEEGARHPTRGGLRIGKKVDERAPDEPMDERLEWERDGQYYHYLTKWMRALGRMSRVTGEAGYLRWAMELAQTAHRAFRFSAAPDGSFGLHWKMSSDLRRSLVPSVGQHDPLDGLVTCCELLFAARGFTDQELPDLEREVRELTGMCRNRDFSTDDTLGIGSILVDACRSGELIINDAFQDIALFQRMVHDGLLSLEDLAATFLDQQARYRLAFRELGLSIGLKGAARLARVFEEYPDARGGELAPWLQPRLEAMLWFHKMSSKIEAFWIEEMRKGTEHWRSHGDINMVMLATSLVPEQFLRSG
ncbi:hypothetical protein KP001_02895 [Geomonas subterranea]|uniref:Uncharacterized protein n=1 Tax=Geomonas subterranea TaxID=2847989 RepID=A0ABX8LJH8_9BACT|nr:hypothetical protein [Geomonas subterranea]QXE91511.1 hypothetical protein KP001_02895 [Geomonas subterranea]QXM10401.1 hypothetical protein KP002_04600 [Geomonas subterranea]